MITSGVNWFEGWYGWARNTNPRRYREGRGRVFKWVARIDEWRLRREVRNPGRTDPW